VSPTDSASDQNPLSIVYGGGVPNDRVEDLFLVTLASAKTLQLTLTPDTNVDLDLFLLNAAGTSILASSNGPTGNESISMALAAGSYIVGVSDCCGGPGVNYTLSIPAQMRQLVVNKGSGTGTGAVASSPAGIDLGAGSSSGSTAFPHGTVVKLTATPALGSAFTGWSGGGCTGASRTCSVTLDADKTITATFSLSVVGDFGGDGKADILWRNVGPGSATGALFVWLMNGKDVAGATYLDPIGTEWVIQATGDFNGDGKSDVLWRNRSATGADAGKLYIWMMDGPTVIAGTGYTNSQADFAWEVQGVGDLDGDGRSDIVWRSVSGAAKGAMFLWLMDGSSIKGATYLDPISTDWVIQRIGDFTGDGKADVLWRNMTPGLGDSGFLYLWVMNGPSVAAGTGYPNSQADYAWTVQAIGDLDGDGKQDIVWRAVSGPAQGAMFLWLMDGKTIKAATYLDPIGTDWQVQGTGDFNGDRKSDILWRNMNPSVPDAGKLYLWIMNGAAVSAGTGYPNSNADFTWDVKAPR
jgi:hypothetical protein